MREMIAEVLVLVLLAVVPFLIGRAFAWWRARASAQEDKDYANAIEALEVGVQEAWEGLGKSYKMARADGKLDAEERAKLREHAIIVAKNVAQEQGLDVLKIIGARTIPLILRKIVEARKKKFS